MSGRTEQANIRTEERPTESLNDKVKRSREDLVSSEGILRDLGYDKKERAPEDLKDFFWDKIIKYSVAGMFLLTILDVLSSIRGISVQCMTPDDYTIDQGAYINSYCSQYTAPTDFFAFILLIQGFTLALPYYSWSIWFAGRFRFFTALSTSLDRHREGETGTFAFKNFIVASELKGALGETARTYLFYAFGLFLELGLVIAWICICSLVFNDYSPPFSCPRAFNDSSIPERWPLDRDIYCVLSTLNVLRAVWYSNFILLGGVLLASLYGCFWCIKNHEDHLSWNDAARFSLASGISHNFYVPKPFFARFNCRYRITSDLHFLYLKLVKHDAGYAYVLREVLIEQIIQEKIQREYENMTVLRQILQKDFVTKGKTILRK